MSAHQPVLLSETVQLLAPSTGKIFVDATCGAGGHSERLAAAVGPDGLLIAMDQDEAALAVARERLAHFNQVSFVQANFRDLTKVLRSLDIERVDGILADLGLSSLQMDDLDRGFSYRSEQELDMRMDRRRGSTAAQILGRESEEELGRIFREFGEERRWRTVARAVVRHRQQGEPFTGKALEGLVHRATGRARTGRVNAAVRVFQALRIAVNDELGALEEFLPQTLSVLKPGGRVAVISFHSLEDRRVKNFFRQEAKGCICPPDLPVCGCGRVPTLKVLTGKVVRPGAEEVSRNPRARSGRLRAAERLAEQEGRQI